MLKMIMGSIALEPSNVITIQSSSEKLQNVEIRTPIRTSIAEIRNKGQITELVIGYITLQDLNFLASFPNIIKIWIITPFLKDIHGLTLLNKLEVLKIDRPTYKMHVLGQLQSLREISIDDWKSGTDSIFELKNLQIVRLNKFPHKNFQVTDRWKYLKSIEIHRGKLTSLQGLSKSIEILSLSSLKMLEHIRHLSEAILLREIKIQRCRKLVSTEGIHKKQAIESLMIADCGLLQNISSLESMNNLKRLYLARGTYIAGPTDSIHTLNNLERLVISKKSSLDASKFKATNPHCELIVTG